MYWLGQKVRSGFSEQTFWPTQYIYIKLSHVHFSYITILYVNYTAIKLKQALLLLVKHVFHCWRKQLQIWKGGMTIAKAGTLWYLLLI